MLVTTDKAPKSVAQTIALLFHFDAFGQIKTAHFIAVTFSGGRRADGQRRRGGRADAVRSAHLMEGSPPLPPLPPLPPSFTVQRG